MIRLIVSDMDGSLLNSKKELPSDIFDVIEDANSKGIEFAIASGRSYGCLLEMFAPVKDKISFICDNGAYVVCKGKPIYASVLSQDKYKFFINEGRKHQHIYMTVCAPTRAFVENASTIPNEAMEEINHYYSYFEEVEDLCSINEDPLKICYLDLSGAETNIYPALKPYSDNPRVVLSADVWVDVVNKEVNKGHGLKLIQDTLNLKSEDTAIFGDYLNDLELFDYAAHTYAPSNAHDDIKKIAKHLIGHHDDWSVCNKIKEIIKKI
ncbi:HAD family hydrolase [Anaerorhabdus sp.]|uniref:HAD family hydrolase n=1 Tax=Anaerorhabdus sp. TaxID=1872524 RepID=UPI002FCC270A